MPRKRKLFFGAICIINCIVLAAAAFMPSVLARRNEDLTTIIGLEYPLSINTVSILLEGGGLAYVQESQDNMLGGSMSIYSPGGTVRYSGKLDRFQGRGNNSWYCPKKGYGITIRDSASLLNLGKARGYVLTPTYRDASLLNFKIAYDLAKEVGIQFAHNADYVELYVNQEYLGVYILTEQNEINKDRYDLTDLEYLTQAMNDKPLSEYPFAYEMGDDLGREVEKKAYWLIEKNPVNITGGYLLEMDQAEKVDKSPSRFRSDWGMPIGLKSPEYASKEQLYYISQLYQDFEDALYSEDGYNDKGKYYLDYIDLDSFAKTWIMNELTMDTSILSSQFIWKDSDAFGDNKFHAGSIWDMEHSFVEADRTVDYLRGEGFWGTLYTHADFREKVYYTWMEKYVPAIKKLYGGTGNYKAWELNSIDTYVDYIRIAAGNNFEKWSESWEENVDERGLSSWEEEIDYVKRFIADRSAYLTISLSAYPENFQSMHKKDGVYWGVTYEPKEENEEEFVQVPYTPGERAQRLAEELRNLY